MAKIKKTESGLYTTRVYIGRDDNGKQLFRYLSSESLKEIKSMVREAEEEKDNNTASNLSEMSFKRYADEWLEIVEPELKPSTFKSYHMYVNVHFKPFFGNKKLYEIRDIMIRRYVSLKLEKGLSASTIRKHYFILNRMLKEALKAKNPCVGIKLPKIEKYKPYVLSDDEANRIFSAVKGTFDELPILLIGWCGIRPGEIFALKWTDISDNVITIDEALSISQKGGYEVEAPKSEKGVREVVAPEYIVNLFSKYKLELLKAGELKEKIFRQLPDNYSKRFQVLIQQHNDLFDGKTIPKKRHSTVRSRAIVFKLQKEKLPNIRFYDLRHYHASVLYKTGVPDQYASERLGHDINVLKGVYQHLQLETREVLDNKITDIFNDISNFD